MTNDKSKSKPYFVCSYCKKRYPTKAIWRAHGEGHIAEAKSLKKLLEKVIYE